MEKFSPKETTTTQLQLSVEILACAHIFLVHSLLAHHNHHFKSLTRVVANFTHFSCWCCVFSLTHSLTLSVLSCLILIFIFVYGWHGTVCYHTSTNKKNNNRRKCRAFDKIVKTLDSLSPFLCFSPFHVVSLNGGRFCFSFSFSFRFFFSASSVRYCCWYCYCRRCCCCRFFLALRFVSFRFVSCFI